MRQQHAGGDFAGMPRRQDLLQAASSDGRRTQAVGQHGNPKSCFCRRDQQLRFIADQRHLRLHLHGAGVGAVQRPARCMARGQQAGMRA